MANNNLYNLIMHSDPEFWSGDKGYVDFPRERFLEYTEEKIKAHFQSLDQNVIDKLKNLPTLFAVEHENADTKIGKVTDIEVQPYNLRIHYKFQEPYSKLSKGALRSPELNLSIEKGWELYRTHWAIKESNIAKFIQDRKNTLEGIFDKIKIDLDKPNPEKSDNTKVSILYANNASGKTRVSKLFADNYDEQVIYYNAYTEDLFSWDNDNCILKINNNKAWIFRFIEEQGIFDEITENFKKFTGLKLEPVIDIPKSQIIFGVRTGDNQTTENIKISRGEESIFIWSIFYTVLEEAAENLNTSEEKRTSKDFDAIKYIVIDDPVSSMDDTRIITVALELSKLIKKSKNQLKFLITTHHALFFNVLFTAAKKMDNWDKKFYILSKSGNDLTLKGQGNESPFAYHHVAMSEIEKAISDSDIKKYHFNIFRTLLEKTANFLGYESWKACLKNINHTEVFLKIIDHYSHNRLSDLEYKEPTNEEIVEFKEVFEGFKEKYKWGLKYNV